MYMYVFTYTYSFINFNSYMKIEIEVQFLYNFYLKIFALKFNLCTCLSRQFFEQKLNFSIAHFPGEQS